MQEIFRIDLGGVNSYLGRQGDTFVLFDTGGHLFMDKQFDSRREMIEKELNHYGCNATNLKLIVLTHGDNDHVANAAYLREKFHTKIAMHGDDVYLVDCPSIDNLLENCHYHSLVFKLMSPIMNNTIKKLSQKTLDDFENFKPDIILEDGFDLSPYGFEAKVIHIPGHTKGSIGILAEEGNLLAGDIFANVKKPAIAPNACSFQTLRSSVNKIKAMPVKTIYPGHGSPFDATELSGIL